MMFYSHEILTSREHGVATIWLVATLGSKSTLKKVSRKAILDVNVAKACETITDADAPMALRLQGSLLFGVSRVFSQQCGYVLSDMQNLRNNMRGAAVALRDLQIDHGVALRNDQLNLHADPTFDVDADIGLDLSVFDVSTDSADRTGSLSSQSLPSTQSSLAPIEEPLRSLRVPPTDTSTNGLLEFRFDAEPMTSEAPRAKEYADLSNILEGPAIDEDPSFDIADDGGLIFRTGSEQVTESLVAPHIFGRLGSEMELETAVGGERAEEVTSQLPDDIFLDEGNALVGEDELILPQLDPVPSLPGTTSEVPQTPPPLVITPQRKETETELTAEAPQRRARITRPLQADRQTELTSTQLKEWSTSYTYNMIQANDQKLLRQSLAQARKTAAFWVLEQGLGGVSINIPEDRETHPLSIFSGQALLDILTGGNSSLAGRKRSLSMAESEVEEEQVSRARGHPGEDMNVVENQGGFVDDDGPLFQDDDDIESEMGRRPASSLKDHPSLSMPWNILAASRQSSMRGSSHPGTGSSIRRGPPYILSGRRSRLTTASPLAERGELLPRLDSPHLDLSNDSINIDPGDYADFPAEAGFTNNAGGDFELYEPAAPANTQQTGQSWWSTTTIDSQTYNFLQYLDEQLKNQVEQDDSLSSITFDELLSPESTSKAVIAHGFIHVLTLATKGLVGIEQQEAFGRISLSLTSHNEAAEGSDNDPEIMG